MVNIIIIPVRSGSKGLEHKNIKLFCGQPLLGFVLEKIVASDIFEHIIVTSDSPEYLNVATNYGATDVILRPHELATDESTTSDVLKHAILDFEDKLNISEERYFLAQVTSPLWNKEDLTQFVNVSWKSATSVVSTCVSKQHPEYNLITKSGDGYSLMQKSSHKQRQDHSDAYFINGCFYSFRRKILFEKSIIREDISDIHNMHLYSSIDIDTLEDFQLCETIAQHMAK